jgi:hypothetical protein
MGWAAGCCCCCCCWGGHLDEVGVGPHEPLDLAQKMVEALGVGQQGLEDDACARSCSTARAARGVREGALRAAPWNARSALARSSKLPSWSDWTKGSTGS